MTVAQQLTVEVDGRAATVDDLTYLALGGYGHFTAMQVRGGRTPGFEYHLARLDSATRELYGEPLDGDRVRALIRHALDTHGVRDASVRVHVFRPADDDPGVRVLVSVRPPGAAPAEVVGLRAVDYQRPVAHIKHTGGFGQAYYGLLAAAEGFDEALLVGQGGVVAEGAVTNVGFVEGDAVVWPDAPALQGIAMQVLARELAAAGVESKRRPVFLSDVASFDGAFLTNSRGFAAVGRIDAVDLPLDAPLLATARRLHSEAPWDEI
ncbi:aminotransferase class IV [Kitasatospora sp. NPDC057015]|uniref:aminotransferase class IV n=1 Tax=Kitasatospora sp. NPDC057015 TaxID=3346001 RepID=UPI00363BFFC5